MIPSLTHTQPLLLDLAQQGPPGKFLLTVHGAVNRRYLWVDKMVRADAQDIVGFYREYPTGDALIIAFPVATAWTLTQREVLEFPTLKELADQTKRDLESQEEYQKELYPNDVVNDSKGQPGSGSPELIVRTPGMYL